MAGLADYDPMEEWNALVKTAVENFDENDSVNRVIDSTLKTLLATKFDYSELANVLAHGVTDAARALHQGDWS